ncbi:MAG TPA: hypothetical protein VM051_00680 [Usitatibacter sp.]|nr:hypothetical protein [Usitatibacter sp.]
MIFRFIAAFVSCLAITALATPQPIDATGLWIKPDESGWGVSVYHQGDTLFASLFVYGPDGQPRWYTASAMTAGPTSYTGPLTEATGPYFGAGSFNPAAVTRRTVGTMSMALDSTGANLSYSVDGTQVSKRVIRFTMRPLDLNGNNVGAVVQPAGVSGTEIRLANQMIDIYDHTPTFVLEVFAGAGSPARYCKFETSSRTQSGELVSVSGLHGCGAYPQVIDKPWSMTVDPTPHGFTGTFNGGGVSQGRIAAASRQGGRSLQGTGWLNDLWFPPAEGGWGLNLIEQGDTAFATLFVYDAQNRPKWYSASQLKAGMQGFRLSWSGSLEETTGPYFGAPFNASSVTRRTVGSVSLQVTEAGDALVTYNVDGATVVTRVSRFAFRRNNLSGSYEGGVAELDPASGPYGARFTIDDQGERVNISLDIDRVPHCDLSGSSTQYGAQRSISGTYSCVGGAQGSFRMDDVLVTANGLTGSYAGPGVYGAIRSGNIAGARR